MGWCSSGLVAFEDLTGESSSNSRTMSSSSSSGKSSSGSYSSCRAGGGRCVGSSEKSRSCVDRKASRSAVSLSVVGGLKAGGGGRGVEKALGVQLAVGGVGGGESSRWIWVLLTNKSSKQSSGMASDFGGAGIKGASW